MTVRVGTHKLKKTRLSDWKTCCRQILVKFLKTTDGQKSAYWSLSLRDGTDLKDELYPWRIVWSTRQFIEACLTTDESPTHKTQIFIFVSAQCLLETLRKRSHLKDISPSPIFPLYFREVAATAWKPQAKLSNCKGDPQWPLLASEKLGPFLCQRTSVLLKFFL